MKVKNLRYSLYTHRFIYKDDRLITKCLIVLTYNGTIVGWTDIDRYISTDHRLANYSTADIKRFRSVIKLLNYVFFDRYSINSLNDMTEEMCKAFINDYSLCALPDDAPNTTRSKVVIDKCISHIISFVQLYKLHNESAKICPEKMYEKKRYFDKRKGRFAEKLIPAFQVSYLTKPVPLLRDMPLRAFEILLQTVIDRHTDILAPVALSAFGGLRPSEALNIRRADSRLGPGYVLQEANGEVINIIFDLQYERPLRSDLISVGSIKKERMQKVHPMFIKPLATCLTIFMKHMEHRKYEADYGPLTVNRWGKAMTYKTYHDRFQAAIIDATSEMLTSDDIDTVFFAQQVLIKNVGPHILRHYFSVMLTIHGATVNELMYYRGDKSPESAMTYLQNKGELLKKYRMVNEKAFDFISWKAGKIIKEVNDD